MAVKQFWKNRMELHSMSPGKKLLRTEKFETIATIKRIAKNVINNYGVVTTNDPNNKGYFVSPAALNIAYPVWQVWRFSTVWSTDTIRVRDDTTLSRVDSGQWSTLPEEVMDIVGWSLVNTNTIWFVYNDAADTISANSLVFNRNTATSTVSLYNAWDTVNLTWSVIVTTTSSVNDIRQDVRDSLTATHTQLVTELWIRTALNSLTLQDVTDNGNTTDNDMEITDTTKWLILTSPNWTRWRVGIDNSGNPTFTSL